MNEADRAKLTEMDRRREAEFRRLFDSQHLWPAHVLFLKRYAGKQGDWPDLAHINRDGTFQQNFKGGNLNKGEAHDVIEIPSRRTVDELIADGWVLD